MSNHLSLYPKLQAYVGQLIRDFDKIPKSRRLSLKTLADKISRDRTIALNFICTHNSRRSHIGQIWAATAAAYYQLDKIKTYSGGTEATAFNPRAVAAMERAGFVIDHPGGENPYYGVSFSSKLSPVISFSKVFDDPANPRQHFAAIMTCAEADANCPFIPGANWRFPLPYEDPKVADGTTAEQATYDERVAQIGREIFYAFSLV
jgi:arsenate reductase